MIVNKNYKGIKHNHEENVTDEKLKFLRERVGLRETEHVYRELVTMEVGPTRSGPSSATRNLLGK